MTVKVSFEIDHTSYGLLLNTLEGLEGHLEHLGIWYNNKADIYFSETEHVPFTMLKYRDDNFKAKEEETNIWEMRRNINLAIMREVDKFEANKRYVAEKIARYKREEPERKRRQEELIAEQEAERQYDLQQERKEREAKAKAKKGTPDQIVPRPPTDVDKFRDAIEEGREARRKSELQKEKDEIIR